MKTVKVLIADDSPDFRKMLLDFLRNSEGIEVIGEAADGQGAVEKAGELRPDLILMDIRMPVMNGLEATRKIKEEMPEVKIIILTVFDITEYREAAEVSGADGYITKDSLLADLIPAIRAIFDCRNHTSHQQEGG